MKKLLSVSLAFAGLVLGLRADEPKPAAASAFKTDKEKVSYAIGMNFGSNLKRQEVEIDFDAFGRGVRDTASGTNVLLTPQEARDTLSAFQKQIHTEHEEKRMQQADKNKKAGEDFLAGNKASPGVVTLPSGLQYKVITEGAGESPTLRDSVTVNYRGTLVNGTEFDSSYKRGEPATFPVTGVIRGWTEALQIMKPGAKWQLFIPSGLAYGDFGQPPTIGPGATLLFEVELISVKPAAQPPAQQPITSDIIRVPSAEEMKHGAKPEIIKADQIEKLEKK